MTRTQPSPGPYTVQKDRGYADLNGHAIRGADGYIIAVAIGDVPDLPTEANAHLLAASRDMLADLNAVPVLSEFWTSSGFNWTGFLAAYETWQRNVRRTLAKVAGQEVAA